MNYDIVQVTNTKVCFLRKPSPKVEDAQYTPVYLGKKMVKKKTQLVKFLNLQRNWWYQTQFNH